MLRLYKKYVMTESATVFWLWSGDQGVATMPFEG